MQIPARRSRDCPSLTAGLGLALASACCSQPPSAQWLGELAGVTSATSTTGTSTRPSQRATAASPEAARSARRKARRFGRLSLDRGLRARASAFHVAHCRFCRCLVRGNAEEDGFFWPGAEVKAEEDHEEAAEAEEDEDSEAAAEEEEDRVSEAAASVEKDEDAESAGFGISIATKWVQKAEHASSGKSVSVQVKALLSGRAFQMSKPQLKGGECGAVEWVRVVCKQHVSSTGNPCRYQYRFELHGDKLVELGRGLHYPHESCAATRKRKSALAEDMAARESSVSSQFRKAIATGRAVDELPTPRQIVERRVAARREARADGGSSQSELEAALRQMARRDNAKPGTLYFDEEHSALDDNVVILQCEELLSAAAEFAANSTGGLRLCCDATHDFGLQKWKLLGLGLLGVHYRKGSWHVTFLPMAFAISDEEKQIAAQRLLAATMARLQTGHSLCLASRAIAIFLDGGAALHAAFKDAFPSVRIFRCLQHVKKNIMQAGREWVCKNLGKKVKSWVHRSAFLPPPLFSLFWKGALQELRAAGEGNFADWLLDPNRGGHLTHAEATGCICAQWRCSWADTVPPFSSYSQNAIESAWKAMDLALDDVPRRVDLITELGFLGELTRYWIERAVHADILPELKVGKDGDKASPMYLRGRGAMSDRDPTSTGKDGKGKQWRKLTVASIMELVKDGPFYVREELAIRCRCKQSPAVAYAFPKYDGKKYNEDLMRKLIHVMRQNELSLDRARELGMTTDDGGIDHERIVKLTREYTVVVVRNDRVTESHQDAAIHGETEHSRWVEHNEGYRNHGPIAHASERRVTGRKGIQKSIEKAKAAKRAKVQKKPSRKAAVDSNIVAADATPTIVVTLYGRGRNNEIARVSVEQGVTARRLRELAARILDQATEEVVLVNLDNPMYLVGDMRIEASTRVGVQPRVRGG